MTGWRERFHPLSDGRFLARDGPAKDRIHRGHKACLFGADAELLGSILDDLATEPGIAFVKISTRPRDGVVLGRVFADQVDGVLEVWTRFKAHPRLHCCVQDDALVGPWRARVVLHAR
ncbi:MAG: hypothetical protein ABMB14_40525 [Myxococcota bacterium]